MNEKLLKDLFENNQLLDFYKEVHNYSPFVMSVGMLDMYAKCLYKMKKFDEFHYIANILLKKDKGNCVIFEYLGLSHYRCNNLAESLYNFSRALEIKPTLFLAKCYVVQLSYRLYKRYNVNELLYLIDRCFNTKSQYTHLRIFIYILIDQQIAIGKELLYKFVNEVEPSHLLYVDFFTCDQLNGTTYTEKMKTFNHWYENNQSSTLFITFSPSGKFIMKKYQFPMEVDRLGIADLTVSYCAFSYEAIYSFIKKIISKNNYKNVFLCSASKTSVMLAHVHNKLHVECPDINVKSVMGSPLMNIYPFNPALLIHSYYYLMCCVETNSFLREKIKLLQNDINFLYNRNITILSPNYKMDFTQRCGIDQRHNVIELDIATHNSLVCVTLPNKYRSFNDIKSVRISTDNEFDDDDSSTDEIYRSLWKFYLDPNLELYKFYE